MTFEPSRDHGAKLPDEATGAIAPFLVGPKDWPHGVPAPADRGRLGDLYQGCLLTGAVGDAIGRAVEGASPDQIRSWYPGGLATYEPHRRTGAPYAVVTDDTQLTMLVAETIVGNDGRFDAADFARRLVHAWPGVRGKGRATNTAVWHLNRGEPWWQSGFLVDNGGSAGNGAAMRAAPIGLRHALADSPRVLVRDAVLSALPTHAHRVGVAGAAAVAAGVAWCIRERLRGSDTLRPRDFLQFVCSAIDGMEPSPTRERRPGGSFVRLGERLAELEGFLTWDDPLAVLAETYNGAFALESVPAAFYCFLRTPDDPANVILTAVNGGYDADTVASMAGNLAGAWNGLDALARTRPDWLTPLEERDAIGSLTDGLAALALRDVGKTEP